MKLLKTTALSLSVLFLSLSPAMSMEVDGILFPSKQTLQEDLDKVLKFCKVNKEKTERMGDPSCLWQKFSFWKCLFHRSSCRELSKFSHEDYEVTLGQFEDFVKKHQNNTQNLIDKYNDPSKSLASKISQDIQMIASGCKNMPDGIQGKLKARYEIVNKILPKKSPCLQP